MMAATMRLGASRYTRPYVTVHAATSPVAWTQTPSAGSGQPGLAAPGCGHAARANISRPEAPSASANAYLMTISGSRSRRASHAQSDANAGAARISPAAFTDVNHWVGISNDPTWRLTPRSRKSDMVPH